MGFIRNLIAVGLGYIAIRTVQKILANAEAQHENAKVKAKAPASQGNIPSLKLDPVTGVYRPEA